ncbi:hypothetical protein BJ912DRAFT_992994 [Pholiota molesta]|nr:hypothetical protein BJ912DRAFT_992994 [Pholiota molesta]
MQLPWRAGLVAILISSAFTLVSAAPVPTANPNGSLCALNPPTIPSRETGAAPQAPAEDVSILNKRAPKRAAAPRRAAAPKQRAAPKQKAAPKQSAPKPPHKSIGQKLREWGAGVKKHFQNIGHKIKEGFQKFGQKVKAGFQKFGQKVKVGFQKVGKWFKTTGAKIAKFGLKVISTLGKVASKVVGFVLPGAGKVIGKGLEAASYGLDKASAAIHVSLGAKLDKGMKVMDKVDKYVGYVPRDLSAGEFDERDDGWNGHFVAREDVF